MLLIFNWPWPQFPYTRGRLFFPKTFFELVINSMVAQLVKYLPAVQETQVQSLSQKDPLEKAMATHSRILAWRTPWTEEPGRLQSMGSQRVRHD